MIFIPQSASRAQSQGLVSKFNVEIPQAGWPYYSCCAVCSQASKKKIARGTSTKTSLETLRPSYWRTLYNFAPYFNFEPAPLHSGHQLRKQPLPRVGAPPVKEVTHDVHLEAIV